MLKCMAGRPAAGNQDVFAKPPTGLPSAVWEKEFSVLFNGRKPVGLGFVATDVATPYGTYTCVVQHVINAKVHANHAFDHNEHCYLSCNLKRVIMPGLVIRGINDLDVRDTSFDVVVAKVKTAKRPVLLTFADPKSADVAANNEQPALSDDSDVRERKLHDEIIDLRTQLDESSRQRDEALRQLELFKKWNDSLLATNSEMDATTTELHDRIAQERAAYEAKHASRLLELQHERDHATSKLQELRVEHASMATRADELHARLEAAQQAKRASDMKLAALEAARLEDLRAMEALRREIHDEDDATTELDKLLATEQDNAALATCASVKQQHLDMLASVRQQRKDHEQHKRDLEAKLQAHADHVKSVILDLEHQRQAHAVAKQVQETTMSLPLLATESHEIQTDASPEPNAAWQDEKLTLTNRIHELEAQLEAERQIEASLSDTIAGASAIEAARAARDQAKLLILRRFMTQLSTTGILVHKHGRMGAAHPRFLYADVAGHWLSWMSVDDAKKEGAFQHPRKQTTIELKLVVDVLPGKQTHVFHRTSVTPANRCFSLICAKPCRTIDMETETPEQCQRLIQGFRLIRQAFLDHGAIVL
ncbi:hypothetical protein SPRG_02173 [Saprolegnia parasitica CBS 223.65]|uniref:Uncharacterized protein n=1 Tax=Saprolegnia parasitica (strain CBS 223.65) TaxID=695850 RepID=A0A067D3Q2_SAPPC|nr:hypothetical protein SPRG_02173 [Saprolegnia parasitica CBS 223.65]KDO33366.1 hypothetical protein SPRG_02173 [Saprolegnia parasitica CBS 223.65]|eukprot:XP_012196114.1 hypothetical protein SPRG_02173 [Saprolegnia parasitica CBS 223.65]